MMIEYFSSLALPKCAMTVNGDYLERKVLGYRTTSVSGRDAMTAHINEQTTGDTALTRYLSKREETRDITVSFALTADDRNSHEKRKFSRNFSRSTAQKPTENRRARP